MATAAGVLLGISGWLGLAVLLTWLLVAWVSRYSSLASLVAAAAAPAYYLLGDGSLWYSDRSVAAAVFVMGMLLAWRHSANIGRLVAGTESRLGSKRKTPAAG